jgi:hypothetical protein
VLSLAQVAWQRHVVVSQTSPTRAAHAVPASNPPAGSAILAAEHTSLVVAQLALQQVSSSSAFVHVAPAQFASAALLMRAPLVQSDKVKVAQVALQHVSLSSAVVQVAAVHAVLAGESMRTPLSQSKATNVAQPVGVLQQFASSALFVHAVP